MKRSSITLVTALILLSIFSTSASAISILLRGPADDTVSTSYTIDFLFSFDDDPVLENCSVIVDGEVKGIRNTLIMRNNNKLSIELDKGTHEWYMICYDSENNKIESETRTITLNLGSTVTDGYEIFYNSNGLRTYIFTIDPGQEETELPAMKAGEDIEIAIGQDAYKLDIMKMGEENGVPYIEVRNRATGERQKILQGESASFDVNDDDVFEAELILTEVERIVNAYITFVPYPDSIEATDEEESENAAAEDEETTEDAVTSNEEPESNMQEQTADEEPKEEAAKDDISAVVPDEAADESRSPVTMIIIAAIVIVIILILYLAFKKDKDEDDAPEESKDADDKEKEEGTKDSSDAKGGKKK